MRAALLRCWRLLLTDGSWRKTSWRLVALAVIAAGGALLGAWIGLAPIAASSGHWPVTSWFLHFAMRNSVELRAIGVPESPDLSAQALLLQGAGHYATACVGCHGAPGQPPSLTTQQTTPPPPSLAGRVPRWRDRELFWIVRHGVKFTAMPAWPSARREDEVWSMVAFLRRLPELTPAEWRELTLARPDRSISATRRAQAESAPLLSAALAHCARCHGYDGLGRGDAAFPLLAAQREAYLLASLQAYRDGRRHSGFMQAQTAALDPAVLRQLASYYAALPAAAPTREQRPAHDAEAEARGRALALHGAELLGVPACADCHGPAGHDRNARYPLLAGQPAAYLERQLKLFAEERRGGTEYAHIMHTIAKRLSAAQRADVAAFYQSLDHAATTGSMSSNPANGRLESKPQTEPASAVGLAAQVASGSGS